jgi:hypothetical protein
MTRDSDPRQGLLSGRQGLLSVGPAVALLDGCHGLVRVVAPQGPAGCSSSRGSTFVEGGHRPGRRGRPGATAAAEEVPSSGGRGAPAGPQGPSGRSSSSCEGLNLGSSGACAIYNNLCAVCDTMRSGCSEMRTMMTREVSSLALHFHY